MRHYLIDLTDQDGNESPGWGGTQWIPSLSLASKDSQMHPLQEWWEQPVALRANQVYNTDQADQSTSLLEL